MNCHLYLNLYCMPSDCSTYLGQKALCNRCYIKDTYPLEGYQFGVLCIHQDANYFLCKQLLNFGTVRLLPTPPPQILELYSALYSTMC